MPLVLYKEHEADLESQLGASPVSPLGVVPDGVASAHPKNINIVSIVSQGIIKSSHLIH